MSTISNTYLDIIDLYRRQDKDGSVADIIEVLKLQNPVLDDAVAMECNQQTSHLHTIRTGLPEVSWGSLYKGIPQSKSNTQQVKDTTGFVEAISSVDERLLELSSNPGALRISESVSFLESMNQEIATGIFYHDTDTTPEKFKGLSARYNSLGGGGAGNQIIDAGGTGSDNTSIWFVMWGDHATHLLYPKGTQAGVKQEDKGSQRVTDSEGNAYYVQEEKFEWHVGMAVKDWRYNARIANIDSTAIQGGGVQLYDYMRKAYYKLHSRPRRRSTYTGRLAIYCNKDVLEVLDMLSSNAGTTDSYIRLVPKEIEGQEIMTYRGIPIREVDAIVNTEARVV